jgi:D-alanyl-D-alanine carboxypeptidase/D-alanyl-D-alanine-endopeptidase (penicillin-binding protein 4)
MMTMKKILLCILLSLSSAAIAETRDPVYDQKTRIESGIDNLLANLQGRANVGIIVQSMRTGQVLYQKNASELLVPASNLKLFTAYAALARLGPNFRYQTQFLTDAPGGIHDGALEGNLYAKFSGDPEFDLDDLTEMVANLKHLGLHTVRGNLFVDNSNYQREGFSPGTVPEDKNYCYAAPVDALILDNNCASVTLLPGKQVGAPARLIFPKGIQVPMRNNVVTRRYGPCGLRLTDDGTGYELTGCVRTHHRAAGISFPLQNSKPYGEAAIRSLLQKYGIQITGAVQPSAINLPRPLHLLSAHYSRPLSDLVFHMLKTSDNLIANSLFKQVGAHYFNEPGSWNNGGKAVYQILTDRGSLNLSNMVMVDGSGLSRYNLVSPWQISQLLTAAYRDNSLATPFISSLPIGGINGTLKHRMGTRDMIGRVRAKTGTMKGVSSLSGYIQTTNQDVLVFSIIVNDFRGSAARFRLLEDRICRVLSSS